MIWIVWLEIKEFHENSIDLYCKMFLRAFPAFSAPHWQQATVQTLNLEAHVTAIFS